MLTATLQKDLAEGSGGGRQGRTAEGWEIHPSPTPPLVHFFADLRLLESYKSNMEAQHFIRIFYQHSLTEKWARYVGYKSLHMSQVAYQAIAYADFYSMERLGVFLLPPGWDASPLRVYPHH